jgi:hypothetical protein
VKKGSETRGIIKTLNPFCSYFKMSKEKYMTINIEERYKLIFEEHRVTSDLRVKLFTGWCGMYAALGAAFAWTIESQKVQSWIITAIASLVTVIMWLADIRNRPAMRALREVGVSIENDVNSGIPEGQRFFTKLNLDKSCLTHSCVIDIFSWIFIIIIGIATIILIYKEYLC